MEFGLHEDAEAELLEAAGWYESRSAGLGHAFLGEFERCAHLIQASPAAFPVASGEVRHMLFRRFPYRVLFVAEKNRIYVLAVAHHKRRPGYWIGRQ
jgi:plasmid stabilization system protein ParE